jgi:hypothetical protein
MVGQTEATLQRDEIAYRKSTTVAQMYWYSIWSPHSSRESDVVYMLKPLIKG